MTLEDDKTHFLDLAQYYFPMGFKILGIRNRAECLYLKGTNKYIPEIEDRMMLTRFVYEAIPFDNLDHPDFEHLFSVRAILPILEATVGVFLLQPNSEDFKLVRRFCESIVDWGQKYRSTINSLGVKIKQEDKDLLWQDHKPVVDVSNHRWLSQI